MEKGVTSATWGPTKLEYYDDMWKLQSKAIFLSFSSFSSSSSSSKGEDGRVALLLDSTIFHPQGGGQPADTGFISPATADDDDDRSSKFVVQDVRLKDGIVYVYHYGVMEGGFEKEVKEGGKVLLSVDEPRRKLNSRLHSAGHLLDACMQNVGLGHLEPIKGYHFPDGPFVEYKGTISQDELLSKQKELELEANALVSKGGGVSVAVLPYEEARDLCDGCLPDYIPKDSTPRIVKLGNNPGCPCGGTHVSDLSEIANLKVSQIRIKKGVTKVFYSVGSMCAV